MKAGTGTLPLFLVALAVSALGGPPGIPGGGSNSLATVHPAESEGREVLAKCRNAGLPGDCYYEFELQVLPRRGPERVIPGRLWAGRTRDGIVWRVELDTAAGRRVRWLVQGGSHPAIWRWDEGGLRPAAPFEPLVDGADVTPFDLQFPPPFLYWPKESLVGMVRVLGRPAYDFVLWPPADFSASYPAVAAVRTRLDADYCVPIQTELIGADGRTLKTLSLVDLKKVDGSWIVKEVDVRNEATRNKTRLDVTGAAVRVEFSPLLFAPEYLGQSVDAPAAGRLERFGP